MKKIFYTLLFIFTTVCILTHSKQSLGYALMGLQLWFENMVPALLPFMILSGVMVRMQLTYNFSRIFSPIITPLFHSTENVVYCIIMGFLCGFPMGAKTISDLLQRKMITLREAEFLLAFCNNIGPVYFCSFVLPLLQRELVWPYVFGMYGLPLLYGVLLRHTLYRNICIPCPIMDSSNNSNKTELTLLNELDDAVTSSVQSILSLGGYMIFFNMWNLLPHILFRNSNVYWAPFFEITGGLRLASEHLSPLYALLLLPFGGLSCIAQTNSCLKGTGLSLHKYILHKVLLTAITGVYYLMWFLLSPESFLR